MTTWWGFELLTRTANWHSWLRYLIAVVGVIGTVLLLAGPGWLRGRGQGVPAGADASAGVGAGAGAGADDGTAAPQPGWVPTHGAPADGSEQGSVAAPATVHAAHAAAPRTRALRLAAVVLGVGAALLGPAAYAVATTSQGHSGSIPSAGPAGSSFGGPWIRRWPCFTMPGGGQGFIQGGGQPGTGGQTGGQACTGGPGGQTGGQGGFGGGTGGPGGFGGGTGGTGGTGGCATGGTGGTGGTRAGGGGMGNLLDASTPGAQIQALLKQNASSYRWVAAGHRRPERGRL